MTTVESPPDGRWGSWFDPAASWAPLLDEGFEGWTSGSPTAPPSTGMWDSRMLGGGGQVNLQDVRVVDRGDRCLQFALPAGAIDKGTTMWGPLPRQVDEAILEYDLRFAYDFAPWGWGGKLPGLGGVDMVAKTPVSLPGGGKGPALTNGWSARVMWIGRDGAGRTPYAAEMGSRVNRGMVYTYGFDQAKAFGTERWFATPTADAASFASGRWHRLREHCRMNTPEARDGYLRMQLDGSTVYETDAWMPRGANENVHISHLWMHVFRGGDTAEWGMPTVKYVHIDNIRILTPST